MCVVEHPDAALKHEGVDAEATATNDDTVVATKKVFKLLEKEDVVDGLVGKQVYTLWPDNGVWYRGKVERCSPSTMVAKLYYEDTDEKEEADLGELIRDGHIAFRTFFPHPVLFMFLWFFFSVSD